MNEIIASNYSVYFNQNGFQKLEKLIETNNYSSVFVLVDSNTKKYCLPILKKTLIIPIKINLLTIPPGEEFKTIDSCQKMWLTLSDNGADRKSLLINLGGGVITDMGGFIAATFKRGIDFVNIPTTLLSMVDASIGGKTGVNLGNLKNQIGIITNPKLVIIEPKFLKTLSDRQYKSGYSEMLKHGLISDKNYWIKLSKIYKKNDNILPLIYKSIEIKNKIVLKDPFEHNHRKALNFGHTIGHAIESYFLQASHLKKLTHGEAIAIGMVVESSISVKNLLLKQSEADQIKKVFKSLFSIVEINKPDQEKITSLIQFDKKNSHGNVNFVLLNSIGKINIDQKVNYEEIIQGFEFYNS
tara:strand:+ start:1244 stop:2308 length:1065 start_codon:yes stop_codon:yes gene_type:complete